MKEFKRLLDLDKVKESAFLFGPRMVGKTTLLEKACVKRVYDLLDPDEELRLRLNPGQLLKELRSFSQQRKTAEEEVTVVIDEIQKNISLLDTVQIGIDKLKLKFILSGSSARKLKRGGANMLGGRAIDLRLHPLTYLEIGEEFNIDTALYYGTLPKIAKLTQGSSENLFDTNNEAVKQAISVLKAYNTTYLKEEIQAEALTRNLSAFARFLIIAADSNTKMIENSNIATDTGVSDSTVKDYFSILEDTLLAKFLWPWDTSERRKARPKIYFFDCGVVRAITNQLLDPPINSEKGTLFEAWFVNELFRLKDYFNKPHDISFWRQDNYEVDVLIHKRDKFLMAIEIKLVEVREKDIKGLHRLKLSNPKVKSIVVSLKAKYPYKLDSGVEVLPWKEALEEYLGL